MPEPTVSPLTPAPPPPSPVSRGPSRGPWCLTRRMRSSARPSAAVPQMISTVSRMHLPSGCRCSSDDRPSAGAR